MIWFSQVVNIIAFISVSTFQTEFYISGIAPLDQQLVLLGLSKELDENQKSLRPQLYILEYRWVLFIIGFSYVASSGKNEFGIVLGIMIDAEY